MLFSGAFAIAPAEAIKIAREMPIVWRKGIRLRLLLVRATLRREAQSRLAAMPIIIGWARECRLASSRIVDLRVGQGGTVQTKQRKSGLSTRTCILPVGKVYRDQRQLN